jgi:mono/diheme cytochrome c family protein
MTFDARWVGRTIALAGFLAALAGSSAGPAPAQESAVKRQAEPDAEIPPIRSISSETDGRILYETICQGCHMPDAKGAKGAGMYPALAGNPKLDSPAYAEYIVVHGLRAMPDFGKWLSDAQIAAVVNYVITHFGNAATVLATADEVKSARASQ